MELVDAAVRPLGTANAFHYACCNVVLVWLDAALIATIASGATDFKLNLASDTISGISIQFPQVQVN